MTHTAHTVQDPNADTIRQQLEQQLEERLDLLAELAPRALPSVDPVAYHEQRLRVYSSWLKSTGRGCEPSIQRQ